MGRREGVKMKLLNDYKIRSILIGFITVIMLSGRSAEADFTFGTPINM